MVYADKGYHGKDNRSFLSLNEFGDGIMRKDTTTAKLTQLEKDRNLHDGGQRARVTSIAKNNIDIWIRQVAYNIRKGIKAVQKMQQENAFQG